MFLMNIRFTDEQKKMQHSIREFAREEISAHIDNMENHQFPAPIINKMGRSGWMGIPIPEKYGGAGKGFTSYIIAIHELSKVSAAVGVILSVHTSVGTNPILYFGNDKQKEYYLPKLASGKYLGAFALTESHAGSDAAQLKLKARKQQDHYVLNGNKMFITNGKEADTFITFARTNDDKGSKGISAFIIDKKTEGLSVGKNENKMGIHGTSTVALNFDHCQISEQQLLGEEGKGFSIAMANLNVGRIGIAAQALGIAEAAQEYVTTFAKQTSRTDQATLFKLADMATQTEATNLLVYQAASMIEKQIPCVKEVSIAKLFATKTAREITIDAIQIMGKLGCSKDYPLERFFRDAKVTEIYEGTSEIQRIVIAKKVLKP